MMTYTCLSLAKTLSLFPFSHILLPTWHFLLNPVIYKNDNISLSSEVYSRNKIFVFGLMGLETTG